MNSLKMKDVRSIGIFMSRPLIFLDFDGVINTPFIEESSPKIFSHSNRKVSNTHAIKLLNWIYSYYKYDIVITSTWRIGCDLSELRIILYNSGLDTHINILDSTPILSGSYSKLRFPYFLKRYKHSKRGHEIDLWLRLHNFRGEFIILDDDNDMWKYKDKLILLNPHDGLTFSKATEVLAKLREIYAKEYHSYE